MVIVTVMLAANGCGISGLQGVSSTRPGGEPSQLDEKTQQKRLGWEGTVGTGRLCSTPFRLPPKSDDRPLLGQLRSFLLVRDHNTHARVIKRGVLVVMPALSRIQMRLHYRPSELNATACHFAVFLSPSATMPARPSRVRAAPIAAGGGPVRRGCSCSDPRRCPRSAR